MNLKDIKKQLNKESNDATPDVLEGVKMSPINRLLKNEKALVALKKTAATLTLLLILAIVVVLSVSIYSLMTQKEDTASKNYTFVSIWTYNNEDEPSRPTSNIYSFIVDGDGQVVFAYDETSQSKLPSPGFLANALPLIPLSGCNGVYVMTSSDRPAFARQFYNELKDAIDHDPRFDTLDVKYHVNDQTSRFMLGESLHTLNGYDSDRFGQAQSINDLCLLYVDFVG